MAIKNGRCQNCGSIIRLDDQNEQAVCIFCHAKTPVETALAIEADPGAYTFPNEPQPELSEDDREIGLIGLKSVNTQQLKKAQQAAEAAQARAQKSAKPSPAERVAALQTKPIAVPKLNAKQIGAIIGGSLAFVALILAFTLPPYLSRQSHRAALNDRIEQITPFDVKKDGGAYAFDGNRNQNLRVVAPDSLTAEQARTVYDQFSKARMDVYGLTEADVKSDTVVTVISQKQSFRIDAEGLSEIGAAAAAQ